MLSHCPSINLPKGYSLRILGRIITHNKYALVTSPALREWTNNVHYYPFEWHPHNGQGDKRHSTLVSSGSFVVSGGDRSTLLTKSVNKVVFV